MDVIRIIKGIVIAFIVMTIALAAAAAGAYFGVIDEQAAKAVMFFGCAAGVFLGTYPAAKNVGSRVLVHCICIGTGVLAAMAGASLGVHRTISFDLHFWTVAAAVILSSVLGGIAGVRRQ